MLIYQNENADIKVDVVFENNSLLLSQAQICELFGKAKSTVSEHIKNIFEEGKNVCMEIAETSDLSPKQIEMLKKTFLGGL